MQDRPSLKSAPSSGATKAAERLDRSATALRDNLKRRKAQVRERRGAQVAAEADAASGDPSDPESIAARPEAKTKD